MQKVQNISKIIFSHSACFRQNTSLYDKETGFILFYLFVHNPFKTSSHFLHNSFLYYSCSWRRTLFHKLFPPLSHVFTWLFLFWLFHTQNSIFCRLKEKRSESFTWCLILITLSEFIPTSSRAVSPTDEPAHNRMPCHIWKDRSALRGLQRSSWYLKPPGQKASLEKRSQ